MSRRRFDTVELTLIVALALVAGAVAERWYFHAPPDGWLREAYGSRSWSHGPEEWIARDFFQDRRGGTFLDVGSADARHGSNTYFLESSLGWSGVAIDAMSEYAEGYQLHRPKTQFFSFFVGDRSDATATLWVGKRRLESASVLKDFTTAYAGSNVTSREVPTITLNDLLPQAGIDQIDFLSMDIEMSEPGALAGFDLARYRPALICIESHPPLRQWLIDYFSARGYVLLAKYLLVDDENYWFAPAAAASNPSTPPRDR